MVKSYRSSEQAAFFKDLDPIVQKHKHLGTIQIIGLLEFAKQALVLEGAKATFLKPDEDD